MDSMASLITSLTSVYSTVHSGADQRKHPSSASLAFVSGEFPVLMASKAEMFPFDDVIMMYNYLTTQLHLGSIWMHVYKQQLCLISINTMQL